VDGRVSPRRVAAGGLRGSGEQVKWIEGLEKSRKSVEILHVQAIIAYLLVHGSFIASYYGEDSLWRVREI
jgi:hypothetical protein